MSIPAFSIETYKTEPCDKEFCRSEECLYYHEKSERRRNPYKFKYSAKLCSFIYKDRAFMGAENCPNKDYCELAHNKDEIFYHPSVYKTKDCRVSPCYAKFCAFKHPGDYIQPTSEEGENKNRKSLGFDEQKSVMEEKKNEKIVEKIEKIEKIENIENIEKIEKIENIENIEKIENIENIENIESKQSTEDTLQESIPNKLACKYCKEREIKWVFECGSLFCGKCIGKVCLLCQKKHLTRLDI